MQRGKTIHEIAIGETASFAKTMSETDVYLFAGIIGDLNPLHVNEQYARQTRFGSRIVHGTLTASLISSVLGMMLPGLGTILVELKQRFKRPVYIGDTITATVEAIEKHEDRNIVVFKCTWTNQDGIIVSEGRAKVMPPEE
ncbi:MAG: MaoC family dehydratase [Acidobacteriota bacterium]|nr:MaoC family dehydratase [Blastocatellia bacterium]MDW8239010.1 MaoC family dehydratase [Acidobacteriota bacterium]